MYSEKPIKLLKNIILILIFLTLAIIMTTVIIMKIQIRFLLNWFSTYCLRNYFNQNMVSGLQSLLRMGFTFKRLFRKPFSKLAV